MPQQTTDSLDREWSVQGNTEEVGLSLIDNYGVNCDCGNKIQSMAHLLR